MCSMKHANGLLRVMHAALVPGPMYGPEGIRVAPEGRQRPGACRGRPPWLRQYGVVQPLWLFRQLCFKI